MKNNINTGVKLTQTEFLNRAHALHGNKYDYSKATYVNTHTKIDILCPIHGSIKTTPKYHLNSPGCSFCAKGTITHDIFIVQAKLKHGEKYNYELVKFHNNSKPVKIICKRHGEFIQSPHVHLLGHGCMQCSIIDKIVPLEDIIENANIVHNFKYDYSNINYVNSRSMVKIICKEHGEFVQNISSHILGHGCMQCSAVCHSFKSSKGEKTINKFLNDNKIVFIPQKVFDGCKHINKLLFDFYVPDENLCIEYDGIQHFEPVKIFGGLEGFKQQQKRDKIKDVFCKSNNIKLIRISYKDDIIKILNEIFVDEKHNYLINV